VKSGSAKFACHAVIKQPVGAEPSGSWLVSNRSEGENAVAEKSFKAGDKVSWSSHGGTAHGKVVKKLTTPMDIKGHHVAADKDNPEYLVETDEGKQAAHKADALRRG